MSCPADVRPAPPRGNLLRRRLLTAAIVVVVLVLVGVLYHFPPAEHSFYPRCLFHAATGLHCPGCGGTRCAHALLHGQLAQAAAYNLMVLVCLPYLGLCAFNACWHAVRGQPAFPLRLPGWLVWGVTLAFTLFWFLRNLPFPPFTLLAPHPL